MTHVLNAAEFRGVNIGEHVTSSIIIAMLIKKIAGEDFFVGTSIKYQGLRVEDTPQTQICRYLDSQQSTRSSGWGT